MISLDVPVANKAVAISGIAGPTGGSKEKPVGMVCFAWQQKDQFVRVSTQYFKGDRGSVREQAVVFILEKMMEC